MRGKYFGAPEDHVRKIGRGQFLKLGGTGLAGAAMIGTFDPYLLAQTSHRTSLSSEFKAASRRYRVPEELLLAMGYVNTLWEMPPPATSVYDPDDLHGRGAYGVMQLVQNPSADTLGWASALTGLSEWQLKMDRASNVLGGAAVLADIVGRRRPRDLEGWQDAVAEYGSGLLYAQEVYETLEEGTSLTIATGEALELGSQDGVEVPVVYTTMATADYSRAIWYGAYHNGISGPCENQHNYCIRSRENILNISRIVIHVAEGSYSGTIDWFNNRSAYVSAHYVVGRRGKVAQCVRDKNIAYHAGDWWYNQHSIGIEHAGYGGNASTWTDAMYHASARLSAYVSRKYKIPVDTDHIVRHRQVSSTNCPGDHFKMRRYLRLIRRYR